MEEIKPPLHSYAKCELAHRYNPTSPYESAMKIFRRWITLNPELMSELNATHYSPKCKILSPKQVEIIFRHLGEP